MFSKRLLLTLIICAFVLQALSELAHAQISEFKITASDGAAFDLFGVSVSISGDYAVVGARSDDDNGNASGLAYVFKRTDTTWTEEAKLLPSDGTANDAFGLSVSISGDYAILGAHQDDDNGDDAGSAYVFKRTEGSWVQEAKLLPSDGAANDNFGFSVSISGDYAVVGAFGDDDNGDASGSAYLFKRTGTTWTEEAKLFATDGAATDWFGRSVFISGDYVVVGASANDDNGNASGSAYVFKRTEGSWVQEAKLLPSDGAAFDIFGFSVSISGDYAVVGAFADDDNGDASGSAYLFKRTGTTWIQEAKLLATDGAATDWFGISVSISGDYTLVQAVTNDNGDDAGSAYLFKRTGTSWVQEAKLLASDGAAGDFFGESVSISGDYVVVGAPANDDNGNNSGSVYMYSGFITTLSIKPDSLNFGDVQVDSVDSLELSISNSGDAVLEVTNITFSKSQFSVASPTSFQVPTDSIVNKTVFYSPTSPGLQSGTLTVTSNDLKLPSVTVKLSGTGTPIIAHKPIISEFKITPLDAVKLDRFGFSVSVSGNYAIVGATNNDENGSDAGAAYVFKRSDTTWTGEAKLLASDGAAEDHFGASVSIYGDFVLVGAPNDDDNGSFSGSVYMFKRSGTIWTEEAKLVPSDGAADGRFGFSVSISGDYAVMGVASDSYNGISAGSAYVFKRSGTSWAEEAKLFPSDAEAWQFFGNSISISGDYAVVGAQGDDENGFDAGAVYVFKRSGTTWTEEAKIIPSEYTVSGFFGHTVSINGDFVIVGTPNDDDNGLKSGSAFVFRRSDTSWAQEAKLVPSDGAAGDRFGIQVSLSGDYAVVGAYYDDDNGDASGSAYMFKRTGKTWTQEAKLLASDGEAWDNFGNSVSISGGYTIVGSQWDDDNGSNSGSAYLYQGFISSPTAVISISLDSLEFGDVQVGSSDSLILSIINIGAATLDVTNITLPNSEFSLNSSTSFQVVPNSTLNQKVFFNPISEGLKSVTLTVTSSALNLPSATLKLSGTGIDSTSVGIRDELTIIPTEFSLRQNYPNPFNPETVIKYSLPQSGDVILIIYNLLGEEVIRLVNEYQPAGEYRTTWDASNFPSGIYFYRLQAGDFVQTRKMVLLK